MKRIVSPEEAKRRIRERLASRPQSWSVQLPGQPNERDIDQGTRRSDDLADETFRTSADDGLPALDEMIRPNEDSNDLGPTVKKRRGGGSSGRKYHKPRARHRCRNGECTHFAEQHDGATGSCKKCGCSQFLQSIDDSATGKAPMIPMRYSLPPTMPNWDYAGFAAALKTEGLRLATILVLVADYLGRHIETSHRDAEALALSGRTIAGHARDGTRGRPTHFSGEAGSHSERVDPSDRDRIRSLFGLKGQKKRIELSVHAIEHALWVYHHLQRQFGLQCTQDEALRSTTRDEYLQIRNYIQGSEKTTLDQAKWRGLTRTTNCEHGAHGVGWWAFADEAAAAAREV